MPKRRRSVVPDYSPESDDSSDSKDDDCMTFIPDPDDSGCSDDDSESEEIERFLEKNSYSKT